MVQSVGERTVTLLNPGREATAAEERIAPRLPSLKGAKVWILVNGKAWGFTFFDEVSRLLRQEYGAETMITRKGSSNAPATPETLEELAQTCDAVVDGVQD